MLLEILVGFILCLTIYGFLSLAAIILDLRDRSAARKAGQTPPYPALGTQLTNAMIAFMRTLRKPSGPGKPKPAPAPKPPATDGPDTPWWNQRP